MLKHQSRTYKGGGGGGGALVVATPIAFFGFFSQTIKHQHLVFSVAVRLSL